MVIDLDTAEPPSPPLVDLTGDEDDQRYELIALPGLSASMVSAGAVGGLQSLHSPSFLHHQEGAKRHEWHFVVPSSTYEEEEYAVVVEAPLSGVKLNAQIICTCTCRQDRACRCMHVNACLEMLVDPSTAGAKYDPKIHSAV